MAISPNRKILQTERVDLVKRLFAVAFSFGFAGRIKVLYDCTFSKYTWPTCDDLATFTRLITGMIFVVICWNWFHKDIKKSIETTYYSIFRFLLDVIITLAYMTLLYISKQWQLLVSYVVIYIFLFFFLRYIVNL